MGIEAQSAFIIGALTAGGGTFGYLKSGSVPSIAAGLTVGTLYLLGGYRIQTKQSYGVELALLASVILAGSSIPRAIKTQKPLPIGLSALALYGLYTFGMGTVYSFVWSSSIYALIYILQIIRSILRSHLVGSGRANYETQEAPTGFKNSALSGYP